MMTEREPADYRRLAAKTSIIRATFDLLHSPEVLSRDANYLFQVLIQLDRLPSVNWSPLLTRWNQDSYVQNTVISFTLKHASRSRSIAQFFLSSMSNYFLTADVAADQQFELSVSLVDSGMPLLLEMLLQGMIKGPKWFDVAKYVADGLFYRFMDSESESLRNLQLRFLEELVDSAKKLVKSRIPGKSDCLTLLGNLSHALYINLPDDVNALEDFDPHYVSVICLLGQAILLTRPLDFQKLCPKHFSGRDSNQASCLTWKQFTALAYLASLGEYSMELSEELMPKILYNHVLMDVRLNSLERSQRLKFWLDCFKHSAPKASNVSDMLTLTQMLLIYFVYGFSSFLGQTDTEPTMVFETFRHCFTGRANGR